MNRDDPVNQSLQWLGFSGRGGRGSRRTRPHTVHLTFGAKNLLSTVVGTRELPNPLLVVYGREATVDGGKWRYLWRSETFGGSNNPDFESTMAFRPDDDMVELRIDVFDGDRLAKRRSQLPDPSRLIGSALYKAYLTDLLSGRRFDCPLELRDDPQWDVRLRQENAHIWLRQSTAASWRDPEAMPLSRSSGSLSFIVGARNLLKLNEYTSSDPTVVVSARNPDTDYWDVLGRTELSVNNHDPIFERVFSVPGLTEVKLEVYLADSSRHATDDFESIPAERRLVGSGVVSLRDALASPAQEAEVCLGHKTDDERHRALGAKRTTAWLKVVDGYENYDGPGDSIDIALGCRDLLKIGFLYKSDPLAALYIRTPSDRSFRFIGRTELIPNHHNPLFRKYFRLSGKTDLQTELRVDVYDGDPSRHSSIDSPLPEKASLVGSSTFRLSELLISPGQHVPHVMWHAEPFKSSALHTAGAAVVAKAVDRRSRMHTIQFNVGARNMVRLPGYERTDPMIVLYKKDADGLPWKYVDRTRHLLDALNPSFDEPLTLRLEQDVDPFLKFCVFHGPMDIDEALEPPTENLIGATTVRLGKALADSNSLFGSERGPGQRRAELQLTNAYSRDMDRALNTRGSLLWVSSTPARVGWSSYDQEAKLKDSLLELLDRDEDSRTYDRLLQTIRRVLDSVERSGSRVLHRTRPLGATSTVEATPTAWVRRFLLQIVEEMHKGPRRESLEGVTDILRGTAVSAANGGRADELYLAGLLNDVADELSRRRIGSADSRIDRLEQKIAEVEEGKAELAERLARTEDKLRLNAGLDDFRRLNRAFFETFRRGESMYTVDPWVRRDRSVVRNTFVTYRLDVQCRRLATEFRRSGQAEPVVFVFRQDQVTGVWHYISRTEVSRDNISPSFRDSLLIEVDRDVDINPTLKFNVYDGYDYDPQQQTIPLRSRLIGTCTARLSDLLVAGDAVVKRSLLNPEDSWQNRNLLKSGSTLSVRNGRLVDGLLKYQSVAAILAPEQNGLKITIGLSDLTDVQCLEDAPLLCAVYYRKSCEDEFEYIGRSDGVCTLGGSCEMTTPVVAPWIPDTEEEGDYELKLDFYTGALAHSSWLTSVPGSSNLVGTTKFSLQQLADREQDECKAQLTHPDGIAHRDLRAAHCEAWVKAELTSDASDPTLSPPRDTVFKIRVGCRDLTDDYYREQGAGHTVVALYQRLPDSGERFKLVDSTELSRNMQNPSFSRSLHMQYNTVDDPVVMLVAYYQKYRGRGAFDRATATQIGSALMSVRELVDYPDKRVMFQLHDDNNADGRRHLRERGSTIWAQVEGETEILPEERERDRDTYDYNDIVHVDDLLRPQHSALGSQLKLALSCRNVLVNYEPSVVAALYRFDEDSGNWLYVGCSETVCDNSQPSFSRTLKIDYYDDDTEYKINIYDNMSQDPERHLASTRSVRGADKRSPAALPEDVEFIGSARFRLGDIAPDDDAYGATCKKTFQLKNSRLPGKHARLIDDGTTVTVRARFSGNRDRDDYSRDSRYRDEYSRDEDFTRRGEERRRYRPRRAVRRDRRARSNFDDDIYYEDSDDQVFRARVRARSPTAWGASDRGTSALRRSRAANEARRERLREARESRSEYYSRPVRMSRDRHSPRHGRDVFR